jgi:hypothetical protein
MLELRLRSGTIVSFDGRVLEVFDGAGGSRRYHVTGLSAPRLVEAADGTTHIELEEPPLCLPLARSENPACARLIAAIEQARAADDPLGSW